MKDLVAQVVADKTIDASEVEAIRAAVYADGVVEMEEVRAMFEMNDACSDSTNDAEWKPLFVKVVSEFILGDKVVDAEEADFLIEMIGADGKVDEVEKALLLEIGEKAEGIDSEALNTLIDSLK